MKALLDLIAWYLTEWLALLWDANFGLEASLAKCREVRPHRR